MGDAMCGIVACRTSGKAAEFLLPALAQLEYRGYDSAGVAVGDPDAGDLNIVRAAGRLLRMSTTSGPTVLLCFGPTCGRGRTSGERR